MRTKEVGSMKKYSIIYADPPWAYRTYSKKGQGRSAESHYPTMCIESLILSHRRKIPFRKSTLPLNR